MRLTTSTGINVENPTAAQVTEILESFSKDTDSFAILEKNPQVFIQTAMLPGAEFILEYREGSSEQHFRSKSTLPLEEIQEAFQLYLLDDMSFKDNYEWELALASSGKGCLEAIRQLFGK